MGKGLIQAWQGVGVGGNTKQESPPRRLGTGWAWVVKDETRGGLAGTVGEEAHQTSEGDRANAEQSNRS